MSHPLCGNVLSLRVQLLCIAIGRRSLRSQYEVEIVLRIHRIIYIGTRRQPQLSIRQHLGQRVIVRICLQTQFHHCIPNDLRRALVVAQHNALIQHDAIQFHMVRLVGDSNDVKVGTTVLLR